jgi:hypothetical protein
MTTLRATLVAAILVSGRLVAQAPTVDPDNIGGVVRGPRGPEAGVWVIAETRDLPTKLVKARRRWYRAALRPLAAEPADGVKLG